MYHDSDDAEIESLIGKTLKSCTQDGEEIRFEATDGDIFIMFHRQDCCEHVYIESVNGSTASLVGSPIIVARESSNHENAIDGYENENGKWIDSKQSQTWTFYTIATTKGYIDIRWCGTSNGYYSQSVSFVKLNQEFDG